MSEQRRPRRGRLVPAGILLGIGLGGFFDGIVLHQILQWHHMVSTPVRPDSLDNLEVNTLGDGLFHAATLLLTVAGLLVLVSSSGARHEGGGGRMLLGAGLAGWGGFNLVEGVVDHHLLNLHHVRPGPDELAYDLAFLVWGALMLVVGAGVVRRSVSPEATPPARR